MERTYLAIDLKSFYASVECAQRGLDPLTANLVVADVERTDKTICLAVSPSLKALGISGRARLFEVKQRLAQVNAMRRHAAGGTLRGKSIYAPELERDPSLEVDFVAARPQMAVYLKRSAEIYDIYLRHVSPEDVHVYSIDEVFIDVTGYLRTGHITPRAFAEKLLAEVLQETGITATCGIGSNLYLAKVAMDIVAKHAQPNEHGARIAQLTESSYRRRLWAHTPITDFWRVGLGYARKLAAHGMHTMGDIARCSLGGPHERRNEDLLYRLFGKNAELLIDHAWGYEPCTMADVKSYRPKSNSLGSGQVLMCPYEWEEARLVMREMADQLSFDLVDAGLECNQVVITVGYDISNCLSAASMGETVDASTDWYGRSVPRHAHGTATLPCSTSSSRLIVDAVMNLFDQIVSRHLLVRRLNVVACGITQRGFASVAHSVGGAGEQLSLLEDPTEQQEREAREKTRLAQEHRMQQAILAARHRFGKNAVLKGMDLKEGATTIQRNSQIGGHRA
ncbi:MAG: DNA repair protein [Eggerthellaceae bacterium]|nr:DNA repair protein [Eggerthellaceae bacterium]